ncbi:hypothetical protein D3C80_1878090 [compost metagenome]
MANKKVIFKMDDILEPSLCKGAPSGITKLRTCAGIPIFSAAAKLAGIVAILLQVPTAVKEGIILLLQKTLKALFPPATRAYKLKNTKK